MEHCFTCITVVLLTPCVLQINDDDYDDYLAAGADDVITPLTI